MDTIVALSSGQPPAAIAVLRVSGSVALATVAELAGRLPPPRQAGLRALRRPDGELLDRALVLVFPGPSSATGEDLVELHCHGGRAVVEAVERALLAGSAVRRAEPGEFTRRALLNGRIDLAQAEGLADLLEAETDTQRRAALMASEGEVSRAIRGWLHRLLGVAARIEASLDFAEDGDLGAEEEVLRAARSDALALRADMDRVLAAPPVERLRDGVRVVIAGPPNSGKSTLLNMMTARDAAIVSPHAGTTRDRVEAPVRRGELAYLLTDTAGLTNATDPVERIGVDLANEAILAADLVIWLGDEPPPRADVLWVHSRADLRERRATPPGRHLAIRHDRPETIAMLWGEVEQRARALAPSLALMPLHRRQREICSEVRELLAIGEDPLIAAEQLRVAARHLGRILGLDPTDTVLDVLFSRFCLGK